MKSITRREVEDSLNKLFRELDRPVHVGELKVELRIQTKRKSTRHGHTETDAAARILNRLFKAGRLSKSSELGRVEKYHASPYSRGNKTVTTNVRFYAPSDCSGSVLDFKINGSEYKLKFIDSNMEKSLESAPTKKELVRAMLKESKRALIEAEPGQARY